MTPHCAGRKESFRYGGERDERVWFPYVIGWVQVSRAQAGWISMSFQLIIRKERKKEICWRDAGRSDYSKTDRIKRADR